MIFKKDPRHTNFRKLVGFILLLAPWGNFLHSAALAAPGEWWRLSVLTYFSSTITAVSYLLWGSTFGAGLMLLLRGSENLIYAIGLLGINAFYGVLTFSRDMQTYGWWQPTSQLALNLAFLGFVIWFELRETPVAQTTASTTPMPKLRQFAFKKKVLKAKFNIHLRRKVHVRLAPDGEWAQLLQVTDNGILLRLLKQNPPSFQKPVELCLPDDLVLQLRAHRLTKSICEFHFISASPEQLQKLQVWARLPKSIDGHRLAGMAQAS